MNKEDRQKDQDAKALLRQQLSSRVGDIEVNDTDALSTTTHTFRSGKAKDLSTKGEHQQRMKCSECGKSYLGQKNSSTCGGTCRQRKARG